jgi:hypothetical protein
MGTQTLDDIARQLKETGKPREITVRQLLATTGQQRRGRNVMALLRTRMRKRRLKTVPDFSSLPLDASVTVQLGARLGRPAGRTRDDHKVTDGKSSASGFAPIPLSATVASKISDLLAVMKDEVNRLNEDGAGAFKRADYAAAKAYAHKAEEVSDLLVKANSPHGAWEITDQGRTHLAELKQDATA